MVTILFSKFIVNHLSLWRRRRDLNPRAATNDLLPFQGSPFDHLGTSPCGYFRLNFLINAETGIRTQGGVTLAGFQDRCLKPTRPSLHIYFIRFDLTYITLTKCSCQQVFYTIFHIYLKNCLPR